MLTKKPRLKPIRVNPLMGKLREKQRKISFRPRKKIAIQI